MMARETGLEPATSGVTGRRSNQLSYSRVRVKGRGELGLKGATFPSQGCCRSPCLPEPFAIPPQRRPIWTACPLKAAPCPVPEAKERAEGIPSRGPGVALFVVGSAASSSPQPRGLPVISASAFNHTVTERFLRYVVIDTQSDPSSPTCPSTEKQKNLGRLLAAELQAMGIRDAHLDDHGYVYATIPANTDRRVPVICFCSHMDTSPDCTGKDVKPQIVRNYCGGDIALTADPTQVIRIADHPALKHQIGNDIITTDGTTLLGADNKAGLAEIMDA